MYILAIDQGTSSTKTIIFDKKANVVAKATICLNTQYLEGGWVEQAPEAIFQNVLDSVKSCLDIFIANGGNPEDITTCGISNQRETFVVWDENGVPLYNAVVWQCKRSIDICNDLKSAGLEEEINESTGLIIDPYFSGTKLIWLNINNELINQKIKEQNAFFGTVDSWLLYKLTNGESYYTDYTNASRTLFFNLKNLTWDEDLLQKFDLKGLQLPQAKPSSYYFGKSDFDGLFKNKVAITSLIGDSHAAAFGEGCFTSGSAKATLGTGCSILMNIGDKPLQSNNGMLTTICWSTKDRVDYAFEGAIVSCGSPIEWFKNKLNLFEESALTEKMALSVPNNNGVYIIPAFSGLGAPHWDMSRKASIEGLTFDCTKEHIVRALLESIPYQIKDVVVAMEKDASIEIQELMLNGGLTSNSFVIEFLSDLIKNKVIKSEMADASALGAALLAALGNHIFSDLSQIKELLKHKTEVAKGKYANGMSDNYDGWTTVINSKKMLN